MLKKRREFLKLLLAAPAVATVGVVSSNKKAEAKKLPKAILVDPFQVNLRDLENMDIPELKGCKIVRLRRPVWGKGDPIKIIY